MRSWGAQTLSILLGLIALVAASSAQNVTVGITSFTVTSATLYYGQNQTYGADVTSSPLFPGPFLWQNGTQTIVTLPNLDSATTSGVFYGGVGFSWKQGGLAAGTYSSVHAVFPGATQGSTTWTPADSLNTPLPYASFTVQPAPTTLTVSYTPFTLDNFTQSIVVNVTNTQSTGALPQGPVYDVITNNNGNVLVGNYSCVLTPLNANTVQATLPSSFNANQLLTTGTYTAVYTYYPTSNFTQPDPLTLQFQITNANPPPPAPPPPSPPPSPGPPTPTPGPPVTPPPIAGNGSTTLILEVFYNQQKNWLKQCTGTSLVFWATVGATTLVEPIQGPRDGIITFTGDTGNTLGGGPVQAVSVGHVGLAITFEAQNGGFSGIGAGTHSVTATYSGSTNGVWLPSTASATYTIPTGCAGDGVWTSLQGKAGVAQEYYQGIVRSLVGGAPGSSTYGYGNNRGDDFGYPEGIGYNPQASLMGRASSSNIEPVNAAPSMSGEMGSDGNMGSGVGSSGR